jgi:hypothetical protein
VKDVKQKKDEFYIFGYILVFFVMTAGAFIWQFFMPSLAEKYSLWNGSKGWQTEIAFWNVGIDIGILYTLWKRNIEWGKILCLVSCSLCILLGGHHLFYALSKSGGIKTLHWIGAIEVLGIGGGLGIFSIVKGGFFRTNSDK